MTKYSEARLEETLVPITAEKTHSRRARLERVPLSPYMRSPGWAQAERLTSYSCAVALADPVSLGLGVFQRCLLFIEMSGSTYLRSSSPLL